MLLTVKTSCSEGMSHNISSIFQLNQLDWNHIIALHAASLFSLSFYTFQPPRVVTLAPLPVESSGALATITKSVLRVDDPDNPADVLVMVLEPPRHGRLTRLHGDRALSRFKLEELSREQIQYIHDGSEGTEDGVVLQVNDGHSYRNVLLQVHIDQKVGRTEGEDGR